MKTLPYWPRMMKRGTAAAYCDLSEAEFEREVFTGILPMPVKLGKSEHWCRVAIDAALDRLTGDSGPDWRTTSGLYSEAPAPSRKVSVLRRAPTKRVSKPPGADITEAYEQALSTKPKTHPKK